MEELLTHFAAPPVLMVAAPWDWGMGFMAANFGWKAALGIVIANILYFIVFKGQFAKMGASANSGPSTAMDTPEEPKLNPDR